MIMNHKNKIELMIEDLGWSASELARRAGITQKQMSRLMNNLARQIPQAIRVAKALGQDVEWLFNDAKPWPPPRSTEISWRKPAAGGGGRRKPGRGRRPKSAPPDQDRGGKRDDRPAQ